MKNVPHLWCIWGFEGLNPVKLEMLLIYMSILPKSVLLSVNIFMLF
jgi:hypothetical protein